MIAPTLETWLGHCYAAEQLNVGTLGDALAATKIWLNDAEHPERIREARQKLTELAPKITNRCFISKKHRSYLETALKE